MEPFTVHQGRAVPLDRVNVDTDQIIPKQFLKRIERTGFGPMLFNDWRFTPDGQVRTDFVLNRPEYQGASILLAGNNFGCGSSREHAPWALLDYGFRTVIAPSFADIFYNNCLQNGLLPVRLDGESVAFLMNLVTEVPATDVTVDLNQQTVTVGKHRFAFEIDAHARHSLLHGLDAIGRTLQLLNAIELYEKAHT